MEVVFIMLVELSSHELGAFQSNSSELLVCYG
jgi:hypothetical protein